MTSTSKCGFTPQYRGWEALYLKFAPKGEVRKPYAPTAKPSSIENAISALL